jgi:hypothetical protein
MTPVAGRSRNWTHSDIERAIEKARDATACPRCPMDSKPRLTSRVGPWRLSVGAADVMITLPVLCARAGHHFILVVSLWRRATTPVGGLRVKNKIELSAPQRPRPLRYI